MRENIWDNEFVIVNKDISGSAVIGDYYLFETVMCDISIPTETMVEICKLILKRESEE